MDYLDKYLKLNSLSAQMTGYFSAKALYDSSIPLQAKKEILQFLIKVWKETEPESDVIQVWIEGWEKEIQNLST